MYIITERSLMKTIPGHPNYLISCFGAVWSCRRSKYLKPELREGYKLVKLCADGKETTLSVHRLVLEAFEGPCPPGNECRHLDGNPTNNRLDNLKWGTPSENQADSIKHGTHSCLHFDPYSIIKFKLQPLDVINIHCLRYKGMIQSKIAELYNIMPNMVSRILSGKRWKHIKEVWDAKQRESY